MRQQHHHHGFEGEEALAGVVALHCVVPSFIAQDEQRERQRQRGPVPTSVLLLFLFVVLLGVAAGQRPGE